MNDRQPQPIASDLELVFSAERASATRGRRRTNAPSPRANNHAAAPLSMELGAAQTWFHYAVTHPDGVERGAEEGARAVGPEATIDRVILPGANITASEALEIYSYAYAARLVECLADDYPAVAHALGPDAFEQLAKAYLQRYPSRTPNLNAYGQHMAEFCREQPGTRSPFVADLARLEWALVEIIHAADEVSLAPEELAKVPPTRFQFAQLLPNETLRVHRFEHDVNAYFQGFKNGAVQPDPPRSKSATAIYRQGMTLWRMDLTPAMAGLLEDLTQGRTLGVALERMSASLSSPEELAEAERSVFAWFQSWVRCGFFRSISFATSESNDEA